MVRVIFADESHIQLDIILACGLVRFLGDPLKCLRGLPEDVRHDAGYQLDRLQRGAQPDDFKPLAVYVLHAFQKKSQATPKKDREIARLRFAQLPRDAK